MNFREEDDLNKFLNDEKYFKSLDNYCLGNNLFEAGEILRKIVMEKEKEEGFNNG